MAEEKKTKKYLQRKAKNQQDWRDRQDKTELRAYWREKQAEHRAGTTKKKK